MDAWKLRADLREVWVSPGVVEHSRVRHYAQELSELIKHVKSMMKQMDNKPGSATTNALMECFGNIVLTGQVGQYFGLIDFVRGTDEGTGDLLTHKLSKYLDNAKVYRSDIGVVAERETEGFIYYLDRLPTT